MRFETTYVVDEKMQARSVRQLLGVTRWTRLLIAVGLTVLGFALAFPFVSTSMFGFYVGLVIGVLLTASFMGGQRVSAYRRMSRDFFSLEDDHAVKVTMDEEAIEIRHCSAWRRVPWNRITRILYARDFVMLLHGTVLLAMLSKPHLGEEGQAFLRQRRTLYGPAPR